MNCKLKKFTIIYFASLINFYCAKLAKLIFLNLESDKIDLAMLAAPFRYSLKPRVSGALCIGPL